jgi:phosphoribosyl-AMP cyclohydrolase
MKDAEYTLESLLFAEDGLIPVAVQDYNTLLLLMVAFANQEAVEMTLQIGYATFWKRSEGRLWTKGLTSGDRLAVREIRVNCNQDSLLYLVKKEGRGVCHVQDELGLSYGSCYYRRLVDKGRLEVVPMYQVPTMPSQFV